MSVERLIPRIFGILIALASHLLGQIELAPGLALYEGSEKLTGRLTFLYSGEVNPKTNATGAATVQQYDLLEHKSRILIKSPKGLLMTPGEGNSICVLFRPGNWFQSGDTNLFIYNDSLRQGRTVTFEGRLHRTLLLGDRVFLELEQGSPSGTRILDFNILSEKRSYVQLKDACAWQYPHYEHIHTPPDATNIVHFEYSGNGNKLSAGIEYRRGIYGLKIDTGEIRWLSDWFDDSDAEVMAYGAIGGRFVFFKGPSGPSLGSTLVSSPWEFRRTSNPAYENGDVKTLKEFKRPLFVGGDYMMSQMSPDRRYALVRLQSPCVPKTARQSGWVNTYYLVNATNGDSRILLKDEVDKKATGSVSRIYWVK